jgi:hypothetical protein
LGIDKKAWIHIAAMVDDSDFVCNSGIQPPDSKILYIPLYLQLVA